MADLDPCRKAFEENFHTPIMLIRDGESYAVPIAAEDWGKWKRAWEVALRYAQSELTKTKRASKQRKRQCRSTV